MKSQLHAFTGADVFDGLTRHRGKALIVDGGRVAGIVSNDRVPENTQITRLNGGVLCPGFVDLQVNGGGGVMFNDVQSVETLRIIADAHARLGATSILPTLITDTPDHTERAIDAVSAAVAEGVPGIVGLHLEGPHLSVRRKGAHDPKLIRKMDSADMSCLLEGAARLPILKVTLAPETVTIDQIGQLAKAGVLVSLGHSDAGFETCRLAVEAGARCVTHLYNAMSQLGNREPGLVGATLGLSALSAGLIADGIHVHPNAVKVALNSKQGPGKIFLVSDAMAVAGTKIDSFELNGRMIQRANGKLTLADGTLAGADLDMSTAIANLVRWGLAGVDQALEMATSIPAMLLDNLDSIGQLSNDGPADFVHLSEPDIAPISVWRGGKRLGVDRRVRIDSIGSGTWAS